MQVFGLIGNPVGHSLSPSMHEAAYREAGMDARYVTFEPARDAGAAAVRGAAALGVAGLNVTIPFKRDVLDAVRADPLAGRIGAVNTVAFDLEDGPPRGYNTDAAGVRRAFERHDVRLDGSEAVVVGAGGAGRAAAFALADEGASIHVANRTAAKAESLAADVRESRRDDTGADDRRGAGGGEDDDATDDGGGGVEGRAGAAVAATGGGLDTLETAVSGADVLVNATSVGMEEDDSSVPAELLHGDLAVLDAVYRPLETRLLRDAEQAGATTIDGAWMLLYQGVEAFELWTGRTAPTEAMNEALRTHL